jgi:hypothetical protein
MRAIDVSNYTGELSVDRVQSWRDEHDVGLVIVQAINPPPNYPPGVTRQQCEAVLNAGGVALDVYFYNWFGRRDGYLSDFADLVTDYPLRRVWLDVEDTSASQSFQDRINNVYSNLARLDDIFDLQTGMYTGRWFWRPYMGDTYAFSDRSLWDANYDHIADPNAFSSYGGWTECAIKQFIGTSTLSGVGNIDQNVLSVVEEDRVRAFLNGEESGGEMPTDDRLTALINAMGFIHGDLVAALHEAADRKMTAKNRKYLHALITKLEDLSAQ